MLPSPTPYALYWIRDLEAVVSADGRYKLHFPHTYRTLGGPATATGGFPEPYTQDSIGLSLFDLRADPAETVDMKERHPGVVRALTAFTFRYTAIHCLSFPSPPAPAYPLGPLPQARRKREEMPTKPRV